MDVKKILADTEVKNTKHSKKKTTTDGAWLDLFTVFSVE